MTDPEVEGFEQAVAATDSKRLTEVENAMSRMESSIEQISQLLLNTQAPTTQAHPSPPHAPSSSSSSSYPSIHPHSSLTELGFPTYPSQPSFVPQQPFIPQQPFQPSYAPQVIQPQQASPVAPTQQALPQPVAPPTAIQPLMQPPQWSFQSHPTYVQQNPAVTQQQPQRSSPPQGSNPSN